MTAPRYPTDEGPAAHVANGLQLLTIVRGELDALEARLREALRLLEGGSTGASGHSPSA